MKQYILRGIIMITTLLLTNGYNQEKSESTTGITFPLCKVKLSEKQLKAEPFEEAVKNTIPYDIESWDRTTDSLIPVQCHGFIYALLTSFQEHYPISISPDMIWLLICQGTATHINNNSEELRKTFVNHSGKMELIVYENSFVKGNKNNNWAATFPKFTQQIKQNTNDDIYNLINAEFSTTGLPEKTSFHITLMDAMKSYFSYTTRTLCGIPSITIEGTTEDWQEILNRTRELRRYELDWWVEELEPILEEFVKTSRGKVDKRFWETMFKHIPAGDFSGSVPSVNGWILKFFPYIDIQRNPFLKTKPSNKTGLDYDSFGSGLSSVPMKWKYYDQEFKMKLFAGFAGMEQDVKTLTLRPQITWIIGEEGNMPRLPRWR